MNIFSSLASFSTGRIVPQFLRRIDPFFISGLHPLRYIQIGSGARFTSLARKSRLFTPGPLNTRSDVKTAMLVDLGSRDKDFMEANKRVKTSLLDIVEGAETHETILLQGSGTFVIEGMLNTFLPRESKTLILVNGAYGKRMATICEMLGRNNIKLKNRENEPVDVEQLDQTLKNNSAITHVSAVFFETTAGVLNPIEKIAETCSKHSVHLLIDAMSAFGALPISAKNTPFTALAASSNKCLHSVPGLGFCIAEKKALMETRGNSSSLSLDLYDQWQNMKKTDQYRFTPPIQVITALDKALEIYFTEGGRTARLAKYRKNYVILQEGMLKLGFKFYVKEEDRAPIIATFYQPNHSNFEFNSFYQYLKDRGCIIYPGKLTDANTFRIGCIGELNEGDMRYLLSVIEKYMDKKDS